MREKVEKLAVLLALEKAVKNELKDLRAEVDQELYRLNDETGADRLKLPIGTESVGCISVCQREGSVEKVPYISNQRDLVDYLMGGNEMQVLINQSWEFLNIVAKTWFELTGEALPGVSIREDVKPARSYTRASVDLKKVQSVFRELPGSSSLILEAISND